MPRFWVQVPAPELTGLSRSGAHLLLLAKGPHGRDAAIVREGHHVDLQVRVSKKLTSGQVQSVWDSRYAGERIALVGREPVTATWSDKPFQVTWQTGEEFSIEVWDRKAIFDKTLFLLDTTNGDREFPLRPDTTKQPIPPLPVPS